jgi:chemotaxis protein MotB
MRRKLLLILLSWVSVVLTACVSFNEFSETESELQNCESRLKQANENMEAERLRHAEQQKVLEVRYMGSEEIANRCFAELSDLQTQHNYVKNINNQLAENNEKLQRDIQKQKSVIVLQEKVIRVLDDTKKTIESSLKDQIAAKDIEVVETENQLKMVLVDKILFESGSVDISEQGKSLLLIIAKSIKDSKSQNVIVEGHTDNQPLSPRLRKRFPSNWELSTARAAAVVRFLHLSGHLSPNILTVQGYSFYRALASNDTEEGRRQNRRIEIILSPQN